jgi:hypothetical protein
MKYTENKDSTGQLRGYWDEAGKACLLSEPFEDDGVTLKQDCEIIFATDAEVAQSLAAVKELEAQEAATQYQRDRAREYPPITDYIDGVVKGDQAQIDAYIEACLAVKNKYPKGTK